MDSSKFVRPKFALSSSCFLTVLLLFVLCANLVWGQAGSGRTAKSTAVGADKTGKSSAAPSLAERIAGIRKLLEADQQRTTELEEELSKLEDDFAGASTRFTELDTRLSAVKAERDVATDKQEQARHEARLAEIQQEWTPARDHFELIIQRRKAVQEQLEVLNLKTALEQEALDRASSPESDPEVPFSKVLPGNRDEEGAAKSPSADAPESPPLETAKAKPTPADGTNLQALLGLAPAAAKSETEPTAKTDKADPADSAVVNAQEIEAQKRLVQQQAALRQATQRIDFLNRSIDVFERDLASAGKLLDTAQAQYRAAEVAAKSAAEARQQLPSSATDEEQEQLQAREAEAAAALDSARDSVQQQTQRIEESETLLERLRATRAEAGKETSEAQASVDSAETRMQFLQSPWAPHRLFDWLLHAGPRILVIVVLMLLARWMSRLLGKRLIGMLVTRKPRGSEAERDSRGETLSRVLNNAVAVATIILGGLAILDQTGIDVTVLLGGAAVLGAALAFGSQNLIRDYFSGFMILVEHQYSVGNVVRIGSQSGTVEDITLRTTVLRDEEGVVHFIPHGQIATVSNLTYGWSRAVFKITIGYDEDVDQVMEVLMELARELRDDPEFGPRMLGQPEMLGVDAFGDSAVVIKFLVMTRPLQQWSVKRELLRRIKKRFDKLGIEIPYPQQTVHLLRNGPSESDQEGNGHPNGQKSAEGRARGMLE